MDIQMFLNAAKVLDEQQVPTFDRMIYVPGIGPLSIEDPRAAEYIARTYQSEALNG